MKYSTIATTKQRIYFNESDYQDKIVDESLPIEPSVIPNSVKELHINTNQFIVKDSIPNSVETLVILPNYKRDLPSNNVLPESIHSIIFKSTKNNGTVQKILNSSLPTNLKKLILCSNDTIIEQNALPNSLEYLKINGSFQQEFTFGIFPTTSSLTYLELDPDYNVSITSPGILPSTLKTLIWGNALILPNVIPHGVEFVEVGSTWNQKIDCYTFPQTLKILLLGSKFNTFINDGVLPKGLEFIELSSSFDQPINFSYLESLKSLLFGWNYNREITDQSLPNSLEYIYFGKAQCRTIKPNVLPKSLTRLYFSSASLYIGSESYDQGTLVENSIPSSVKCIQFENGYRYTQLPIHFIPSTVQYLDLGYNFNSILKMEHFSRDLPTSQLKVLIFGDSFNIKIEKDFYIPPSVVSLKMGREFNQQFDKASVSCLPKSLLKLELGPDFNQPVDQLLSFTNIKYLIIKNQRYSHLNSIPSTFKYNSAYGLYTSSILLSSQDSSELSMINQYESLNKIKPILSIKYPKYFNINTQISLNH